MKKALALILAAIVALSFAACGAKPTTDDAATTAAPTQTAATENMVIRLSTTTSVNDSGLLPYLLPTFEAETGYKVEVQSAGTGAAI